MLNTTSSRYCTTLHQFHSVMKRGQRSPRPIAPTSRYDSTANPHQPTPKDTRSSANTCPACGGIPPLIQASSRRQTKAGRQIATAQKLRAAPAMSSAT